ncbi:MAG: hypothetical protein JXR76_07550 [Deltaproteobacteria bacterium]|nr:hypothetical protein [Deltaproteobacteria bacterium]
MEGLVIVGSIPVSYAFVSNHTQEWLEWIMTSVVAGGGGGVAGGLLTAKSSEQKGK